MLFIELKRFELIGKIVDVERQSNKRSKSVRWNDAKWKKKWTFEIDFSKKKKIFYANLDWTTSSLSIEEEQER